MLTISMRNWEKLPEYIFERGTLVKVGDELTKEVVGAQFVVKDARDRLIVSNIRKVNFPFAVAEWLGLMTGEAELPFFQQFVSGYDKYSTDGKVVDGAYGPRLHPMGRFDDQLTGVISELRRDPMSRRAVMSIYSGGADLYGAGGKNTPCTLTLQFLVRQGHVHLLANMRSSDVVWGVTYDVFMFTMLQEYVATQLDLPLGSYYHHAGSLHLYERDWGYAVGRSGVRRRLYAHMMDPMPRNIDSLEIYKLHAAYKGMSDPEPVGEVLHRMKFESQWAENLVLAGYAWLNRKSEGAREESLRQITDPIIRKTIRQWV